MRNITYDNAKGIGLILVILGHLIPFGNLQSSIVYSVHMPLFFYISGIFLNTKRRYRYLIYNYISPYIFFQFIIGGIIFILKSFVSDENSNRLINKVFYEIFMFSGSGFTCMDHLWFLVSLTIAIVVSKAILQHREKNRKKKMYDLYFISLFSLVAILLDENSIMLPFRLQTVPAIIVLLVIGNKYNDYLRLFMETISKKRFVILLASFIALSVLNRTVNMSLAVYNTYILFLLTAFLGISIIIYISKRICLKPLDFIGKNTLILFAIHGVWIDIYKMLINNVGLSLHDMFGLYCYIGTIVVLIFSFISFLVLKRIYTYYDSTLRNFLSIEK